MSLCSDRASPEGRFSEEFMERKKLEHPKEENRGNKPILLFTTQKLSLKRC